MGILLLGFFLFFIIYFAVKVSIRELLEKFNESNIDQEKDGLKFLEDIGILNEIELNEVKEIYID